MGNLWLNEYQAVRTVYKFFPLNFSSMYGNQYFWYHLTILQYLKITKTCVVAEIIRQYDTFSDNDIHPIWFGNFGNVFTQLLKTVVLRIGFLLWHCAWPKTDIVQTRLKHQMSDCYSKRYGPIYWCNKSCNHRYIHILFKTQW